MGAYIPLKVRLTPASIPQVVAYIQTYLRDNPIPSMDTFSDLIASFLSQHPELVAVASVNAKTGAVILTGADIMLNGDSALTLETEITNLNSMISSLSRQVAEAVATVENAQEDIEDLESQIDDIDQILTSINASITQINNTIQTDESLISANTTKNAQQDTRLTAIDYHLDEVDSDIDDLQTLTELHTQQIAALNATIGDSTVEQQLAISEIDLSQTGFGTSDANVTINYTASKMYRTGNICYMLINFTYNETLPSSGYVTINFEFSSAPFRLLGGFGNGLSGASGHFVYISESRIGVRAFGTNVNVRCMMFVEDT